MRAHPLTGQPRELAAGVDGMRAGTFERNLQENFREISRMVDRVGNDGLPAYGFGPLLRFDQPKGSGGYRHVHIPRIRDQIVLRVIHEELVAKAATRGVTLCIPPPAIIVRRFRESLASMTEPRVLRSDIKGFFDNVPRRRVLADAMGLGLDPQVEGLLRRWTEKVIVRPPWRSGGRGDTTAHGLPQGLSISASLAELWASRLDRAASERGLRWFRYVDDIAVVCARSADADATMDWLLPMLRELGLEHSTAKTGIRMLSEGVPWLGMMHYPDAVFAEADRAGRWIRRFAYIRKKTVAALRASSGTEEKVEILRDFHRKIRDEVSGRTSSRPGWYAMTRDDGKWRELDATLHAMIRSVHRIAGAPPPSGRRLPSVHRAIRHRRKPPSISVPPNADQGQCASSSPSTGN